MTQSHKEALRAQIRESYGKLVYTYTTHLKQLGRLTKNYRLIRYVQIILSAISAGGILSSAIFNQVALTWISGIVSTFLFALNLSIKNLNFIDDIKKHRLVADDLWDIREDYISLLTDFDTLSETDIMDKRDKLQERTSKIYKSAPSTDSKSYAAAQKALKYNEEQFFRTSEIDLMLPKHLRLSNPQDEQKN